jgi:hypothetical protein
LLAACTHDVRILLKNDCFFHCHTPFINYENQGFLNLSIE